MDTHLHIGILFGVTMSKTEAKPSAALDMMWMLLDQRHAVHSIHIRRGKRESELEV